MNLAMHQLASVAGRDAQGRIKLWDTDLDAQQIADRVAVPMSYVQVRLEALLLLNSPEEARRLAEKVQTWLSSLDVAPLAYIKKRRGQTPLGANEIAIAVSEVKQLETVLNRAALQARDRVAFCDSIVQQKIESRRLVEEVRDHPDATVLLLPTGDEPLPE